MISLSLKISLKLFVGSLIVIATTACDDAKKGSKPVTENLLTEGNMKNKTSEDLVAWFIPSLSATLLSAERKKGGPLTENEVLSIRDNSQTIMTPSSMVESLAEKRGYDDLNPEKVWVEWQLLRKTLDTGNNEEEHDHDAVVLNRPSDDPHMRKAEETARKTLDVFKQLIKKYPDLSPMIKVRIVDTDTSSRMWLFVDEVSEDSFGAHLFEVPSDFKKYQAGDKFNIENKEILDWMVNNDGEVSGAYTIRVQRESMSDKERQEIDEYMGIKKYLD